MSTAERFGDYLLLRKLATDPLGETYRAGKTGAQGIERVVYLRLFNGASVEREALSRALADRAGVHRALENPHIGEGAEVGRLGDTPYVAYEYISGKSLAELLAETRSRSFPLPVEHALFITERMTFGLTSAYATRHREQRIQHGFLVPDLVLLSNEGEVRVLGFEAGPALRQSLAAGPVRESYGRYLAPEVAPGSMPASSEDVFSLGALLYELLTGGPLVPPADGNYEPLIDQAMVASDEAPLPPSIRALLKSSLTRREERISDVQQWQQALSRFIAEGQYNPTTFNLAFFMHSLFRSEIERETREIEREKTEQRTLIVPTPPVGQRPATGAVLVPPPASAVPSDAREARPAPPPAGGAAAHYGKARSRKRALAAAAAALVVAGGLLAAYLMQRRPSGGGPGPEPVAALAVEPAAALPGAIPEAALGEQLATPPAVAPEDLLARAIGALEPPAPPAAGAASPRPQPSPEQTEAQIRELVERRAREVEGSLQQRYEEELSALRAQLEEARTGQGGAAPESAAEAPAAASPPAAAPFEPATEPAIRAEPQAALTEALSPAVSQTITEAPSAPPAAPPQVGDLAEPGPGVSPPRIVTRPAPRYPPSARRIGKVATVQLRVLVDENGRVAETRQVGENVGFGFDQEALDAARRTTWQPAMKNGVPVRMWVDLRIEFRP